MPAKVKKSNLNLKESVRHKHEDSNVDYSFGECCFDRLMQTTERGLASRVYEKVACYIGLRFYFRTI